jgi:hypothetical protein
VCRKNFHLISKLRIDAHLKYLYRGAQKPRGAKRKLPLKLILATSRS